MADVLWTNGREGKYEGPIRMEPGVLPNRFDLVQTQYGVEYALEFTLDELYSLAKRIEEFRE